MNALSGNARRIVNRQLRRLARGRLVLSEGIHTLAVGEPGGTCAHVTVRNARFYTAILFGGHIGAAEAYLRGWWSADDLTAVIRIFLQNRDVMDGLETGAARAMIPVRRLWHYLRRNTRVGSRKNIAAHYDLSNAFFQKLLDETMTYSCGIFEQPGASLADASIAKYDRLCRRLELSPGDHVIEIGTGWGGFALHAAKRSGCRVTTTTISREQYQYARREVAAAGLDDRIEVVHQDYRELTGAFDKLVSIEMIEAVGHQYFDTFFRQCAGLLKSDGLAAIQAITIQDRFYEQARREMDFIKRYIFPGSCIPSVSVLASAAGKTDLRLTHARDIGPHYAETLRRWRANLNREWPVIGQLGFDERSKRLWEFYLCYCEGGFDEGTLGVSQLVFAKPAAVKSIARSSVHEGAAA